MWILNVVVTASLCAAAYTGPNRHLKSFQILDHVDFTLTDTLVVMLPINSVVHRFECAIHRSLTNPGSFTTRLRLLLDSTLLLSMTTESGRIRICPWVLFAAMARQTEVRQIPYVTP